MNRNIILDNCLYSVGDFIIVKNSMRIFDTVEIKDILFNVNTEKFVFVVNPILYSENYYINSDDILGYINFKEGVDIYELFKRK